MKRIKKYSSYIFESPINGGFAGQDVIYPLGPYKDKEFNFTYTQNEDRSINVTELPLGWHVLDLSARKLDKLPYNFNSLPPGSSLKISNNNLTSLEGCPKSITGIYFDCSNNKLTSLKGGPKTVEGNYLCDNNDIRMVREENVDYVGGNFTIGNNPNLLREGSIWTILEEDIVQGFIAFVCKKYGEDFDSSGGALTLEPSEVEDINNNGLYSKTHTDGWTITGEIHEDYYTWVNDFSAEHPELGRVWGNFEDIVYADSEEG